jgi:AGCS family alanine or glycine:cation symporter
MYYIEQGIQEKWGGNWKWLASLFAVGLIQTSFLTGNGVQANTVADTLRDEFGIDPWISGLCTSAVVAAVILGGIRRIGRVTGILAPLMAGVYILGALVVILMNLGSVIPTFGLIFREAFQPSAGIAGGGMGVFVVTMMWGVRRGLFSNEAGQGSAPIAHAAAKTDEPVSEGVVALLEPFIDTILICTMTGLVILITGVWSERVPTTIELGGGDLTYIYEGGEGATEDLGTPEEIEIVDGHPAVGSEGGPVIGWHEVSIDALYLDPEHTRTFTGTVFPGEAIARDADGNEYATLYADAVESGAPLTKLAFTRGLRTFGRWGGLIVVLSVLLFAISTAISWSYYGDRCANYLFGPKAVLPYKILFVIMHFVGAVVPLATIWTIGDIALGLVTFPNLLALLLLSGTVVTLTNRYFETKPWEQNKLDHDRWVAEHKGKKK